MTVGNKQGYSYPSGVHHLFKDLTGQRFGKLVALEVVRHKNYNHWLYQCDCGNTCRKCPSDVMKSIKKGRTPSCGCYTKELYAQHSGTHRMSRHPLYAIWRSMKQRCTQPNHKAWHNYGGLGITVCQRWLDSFENFRDDMFPTYQRGLDLDRINNDGNYEPKNCRWVSRKQNTNNRRKSVRITLQDGTKVTVSEFSKMFGVKLSTVWYRLSKGVTMPQLAEKAFLTRKFKTS